jgi:hypothetical protein
LINVLPGNSSVNTITGNNRREIVFLCGTRQAKQGAVRSLLPGNAAVNMHPQQWETMFFRGIRAKELS